MAESRCAKSATAARRCRGDAARSATMVALVPMWIMSGAARRSLSRRISMATSAPCAPIGVQFVEHEEPQAAAHPVEKR